MHEKSTAEKPCVFCGQPLTRRESEAKYCSRSCYAAARRAKSQPRSCLVCGAPVKRRERSAAYCSRACAQLRWSEDLAPKLSALGNETIQAEIAEGSYCKRDEGGRFMPKSGLSRKEESPPVEPPSVEPAEIDDDLAWAERADYWEQAKIRSLFARRGWAGELENPRAPLVLVGHGISLKVHRGCLVVRNGLTRYPEQVGEVRFFPGDKGLPPRIINLDSDGFATFDALGWLSAQGVPLVQLGWDGEVLNVIGIPQGHYDPELRRAQHEAMSNGIGLEVSTQLIRAKLEASRETLRGLWRSTVR